MYKKLILKARYNNIVSLILECSENTILDLVGRNLAFKFLKGVSERAPTWTSPYMHLWSHKLPKQLEIDKVAWNFLTLRIDFAHKDRRKLFSLVLVFKIYSRRMEDSFMHSDESISDQIKERAWYCCELMLSWWDWRSKESKWMNYQITSHSKGDVVNSSSILEQVKQGRLFAHSTKILPSKSPRGLLKKDVTIV